MCVSVDPRTVLTRSAPAFWRTRLRRRTRQNAGHGQYPVAVCIHGGGFRAGNRYGYRPLCVKLPEQGYAALTISYRLAPKHQFPAAILDCKSAIRWVRANAEANNFDPNKI